MRGCGKTEEYHRPRLVGDGDLVRVVDDEDVDGWLARVQPQAQLLLDGVEDIGKCGTIVAEGILELRLFRRHVVGGPFQMDVVEARQPRQVEDWLLQLPREQDGQGVYRQGIVKEAASVVSAGGIGKAH